MLTGFLGSFCYLTGIPGWEIRCSVVGGVGPILSHTSRDETRDLNSGEAFTLPPPTSSFIAKWGHDQAQSPGILENIIILLSSRRNRKPPGLSNNPQSLQRLSYLTSGMVSLTKSPRRQLKGRLCVSLSVSGSSTVSGFPLRQRTRAVGAPGEDADHWSRSKWLDVSRQGTLVAYSRLSPLLSTTFIGLFVL